MPQLLKEEMTAVFVPCREGCRRGYLPVKIEPIYDPGWPIMVCGGGAVRCVCRVPGYEVKIVRRMVEVSR
jgi:hypothetical protein